MIKYILLFSMFCMPTYLLAAVDCPLGKDESELTLTRIMLNFGRYTRNADFVSTVGSGAADAVKEDQLDAALVDLPVAMACAQAFIDGTSLALLPAQVNDLPPEEQKTFSDKMKLRMAEFKTTLEGYLAELSLQKSLALENRDYDKAYGIARYIKDWVSEIHEELTVRFIKRDSLSSRNSMQRALVPMSGKMYSVVFYKNDFNISNERIYKYCWVVFPNTRALYQTVVSYCTNSEPVRFHVPSILNIMVTENNIGE